MRYFSVLAKRLAGKSIAEMTHYVFSGMVNLNLINQSQWNKWWVTENILCLSVHAPLSDTAAVARYITPLIIPVSHQISSFYVSVLPSLPMSAITKCQCRIIQVMCRFNIPEEKILEMVRNSLKLGKSEDRMNDKVTEQKKYTSSEPQ